MVLTTLHYNNLLAVVSCELVKEKDCDLLSLAPSTMLSLERAFGMASPLVGEQLHNLSQLNCELPFDLNIPLLGICLTNLHKCKKIILQK